MDQHDQLIERCVSAELALIMEQVEKAGGRSRTVPTMSVIDLVHLCVRNNIEINPQYVGEKNED